MSSDKLELNNLSVYHKKVQFIQLTAEQIIKDFEVFGEDIQFSGNPDTAYQELKSQITPIIKRLLHNNRKKFLSLLYRIDVDEKEVDGAFTSSGADVDNIADLIIERELKKVVIREYYKNKKD